MPTMVHMIFLKQCDVNVAEFVTRLENGNILYLWEPKCSLNHRCVVCAVPVLNSGDHSPRAPMDSISDNCQEGFNVRCSRCLFNKQLPDPDIFKPWFELTDAESIAGKSTDGRKIFYELQ